MKTFRIIAILALFVLLLPVVLPLLGVLVAQAAGCQMNEAGASPCLVFGVDLGGTLAFLGVVPWLGFYTLPLGAALLALWIAVEVISVIWRLVRR